MPLIGLVIDHTVIIDYFGTKDAVQKNTQLGYECNRERCGFFKSIPKIALASPPADYKMILGIVMCADQIGVVSRMLSMGKVHGAYPTTGAIGAAGAACIEAHGASWMGTCTLARKKPDRSASGETCQVFEKSL